MIRKFLKNNQVSVASVRGRDDEDNIKENMTKKQDELDLHNDLAPGAIADEVESDEPEDIETEVEPKTMKNELKPAWHDDEDDDVMVKDVTATYNKGIGNS